MMRRFSSLAFCAAINIKANLSTDTHAHFAEMHIFASVENHTLQLIKFIPFVVGALSFILCRTPTKAVAQLGRGFNEDCY